jgi:hypothetical protein
MLGRRSHAAVRRARGQRVCMPPTTDFKTVAFCPAYAACVPLLRSVPFPALPMRFPRTQAPGALCLSFCGDRKEADTIILKLT